MFIQILAQIKEIVGITSSIALFQQVLPARVAGGLAMLISFRFC